MFLKINKRGVRVGFALVGGVCVSVPLLRCNTVRAAAAALEEYTLTAQQTIALYGSTLDLEIYANNSTYHKNAEFVGVSSDLTEYNGYPKTNGNPDPAKFFVNGTFYDNTYNWLNIVRMQNTEYLIYRVLVDPWSQPYGNSFSINLSNSVNITADGFGTSILWSVSGDPGSGYNNGATHSYYNCSYTLYDSGLTVLTNGSFLAAGPTGAYNTPNLYASIMTLPYAIEVQEDQGLYIFQNSASWQGFNTYYGAVAFAGYQESGHDSVTIDNQVIYIKNEGNIYPKTGYSNQSGNYYNKKYGQGDNSDFAVYLFIQCPTLYGDYILPGGGDSGDIDLSQIEEYLEEQTEYMSNVSEEATVHTRQLIAILAKLEQIYSAMPDLSGLNVPTLHNSPEISVDSQVDSFLSEEFSNADSVVDPDSLDALEDLPVNDFLGLVSRVRNWFPGEVVTVWGILLVLSFVSWFIFRGRGG